MFWSIRKVLVFICAAYVSSAYALQIEGRCISVSDGDTATIVTENGIKEKVRFWGIDAPEISQKFGQESKLKLESLIAGKEVRIKFEGRDKYNRILGQVFCGTTYTNLEMVKAGLAWYYVQYAPNAEDLKKAEQSARKARLGLWKQENPLAPWVFRHPNEETARQVAEEVGRPEASRFKYWVSNSGKTHNRNCKMFFGNSGSGTYTDTPSAVDAKCCGGARNAR